MEKQVGEDARNGGVKSWVLADHGISVVTRSKPHVRVLEATDRLR